jgi:uncharacterized protein (DUF1810 family)
MEHRPIQKVDPLEAILAAQGGGLFEFSTYHVALSEIRHGAKRTCWMWYIWPSLAGVRQHRMPSMILSFAEHIKYLKHEILGPRLIQITEIAISQLGGKKNSIKKKRLFNGQLDSIKFHETCTAFAVAAMANNDKKAALVFAKSLEFYGGLNDTVVQVLQSNGHASVVDVYLERVEALISSTVRKPRIMDRLYYPKAKNQTLFSRASAPVEFHSDEQQEN